MTKADAPDAGSTPAVRAAYKIQLMRDIRAAMMDAAQACKDALNNPDLGKDARRDIASTAKAQASLYQVIMRAAVEECRTLGCDAAAMDRGGKSDRAKRLERQKLRAAGVTGDDETAGEA